MSIPACFSCTKQHGIDIPKKCLFLVPTTWRIAIPTPSTLQISFSLSSKVQNQESISSFIHDKICHASLSLCTQSMDFGALLVWTPLGYT